MSGHAPALIIGCALLACVLAVAGDDSYSRMRSLQQNLNAKRQENERLRTHVQTLRKQVTGIRNDDRILEKAARDELGMIGREEILIIFQ